MPYWATRGQSAVPVVFGKITASRSVVSLVMNLFIYIVCPIVMCSGLLMYSRLELVFRIYVTMMSSQGRVS